MQPFLTKMLLSMLAGSFHHLRWSPSLPEGGHITIAFVHFAKYNSKILLCHQPEVPLTKGSFCLVWRYAVSCFVPERHMKRRLRPYETATALHKHSRTQKASLSLLFCDKRTCRSPKKDEKSSLQRSGNMLYYHCDTTT